MNTAYTIPSNSRLKDYVSMIWEVEGNLNASELILPQGIIEIVFNFAEKIQGIMPGGEIIAQAPRCFIQGIHTHCIQSDYVGKHHLLGIRLHPYSVESLLGILPSELNNTILDLTLIQPEYDRLWHQLAELDSFIEKYQLLERELPQFTEPICHRSQLLSNLFTAAQPAHFQSVDVLAQQVYYSPRQLNRVAHSLFGLSAEELTLYKKFLESIRLIHDENLSLTAVAYSAGFYDQAHFCRVFKSYTGMTPNSYRKQKGTLPFHILY
ncbi:helix-turn-helix domain-containing protein [Flavihumibacter rivuli]|uniref:helix-turn-helix domain-containing protein n=1 Tax=Flavihumibacter rivuli TaxID=2838156 RepID=UPI001BDE6DDA|nr:helix-turn-helix domain-containing protein [Flavihumibacter rivuli]ULQ57096.1 helix-turn-helix domain-containing protein [Flavihumibacter rivuli]